MSQALFPECLGHGLMDVSGTVSWTSREQLNGHLGHCFLNVSGTAQWTSRALFPGGLLHNSIDFSGAVSRRSRTRLNGQLGRCFLQVSCTAQLTSRMLFPRGLRQNSIQIAKWWRWVLLRGEITSFSSSVGKAILLSITYIYASLPRFSAVSTVPSPPPPLHRALCSLSCAIMRRTCRPQG
jgi:hypothetical protein